MNGKKKHEKGSLLRGFPYIPAGEVPGGLVI
jgi:hypothetical protein